MPEIEITPEQEERLRALQEEIARDVVGKYCHVRPQDAVEYLLDRYEFDDEVVRSDANAGIDRDGDVTAPDDAAADRGKAFILHGAQAPAMPEIEITPEQEARLRALQEEIARDVVGKYGHVRPRDAVEYLLDRYESDDEVAGSDANAEGDGDGDDIDAADVDVTASDDAVADGAKARVVAEDDEVDDDDASDGSAGDDAMLDEMMSLLDTHDDKWGDSDGDERYAVELPDGSSEQVRTKDDVKALLFKHYR